MKKINRVYPLIVLVVILIIVSCSKSNDSNLAVSTTCNPNTSFAQAVLPILNNNCNLSGCHDPNNAAILNNYQVVHNNAAQIKASIVTGRMPKGRTLAAADKAAIICWIDNGAKNN
jgi:hypothetical protein